MPKFLYKAKHGLEETLQGEIDASNQEEALQRLMAKGLFPISIVEAIEKEKQSVKKFKIKKGDSWEPISRKKSAELG